MNSISMAAPPADPLVSRHFEHLHSAVDPPEVLLFGLPKDKQPGRTAVVRHLREMSPEVIRSAADHGDERLAVHPLPKSGNFDVAAWQEALREKLASRAVRYMVIDLRDSDLSTVQRRKIEDALKKFDTKATKRIICLR